MFRLHRRFVLAILALAVAYGPTPALALPEGEGRELAEAVCTSCHAANMIEGSSGYTREDWAFLASTMMDLSGNPEVRDGVLDYLAAQFPPGTSRAATPAPGPLAIRFEQWQVPTLGQRSRDPVEAPDGSIWWVGQWLDILGRLDPATGQWRKFGFRQGPDRIRSTLPPTELRGTPEIATPRWAGTTR